MKWPGSTRSPPLRKPELLDQRIQATIGTFERAEILVDDCFGGTGEAPPHARLREPEQEFVPLRGV